MSSENAFENFITQDLGLYYDGWYSDKELSSEVWFWECESEDSKSKDNKSENNNSKSFFSFFGD